MERFRHHNTRSRGDEGSPTSDGRLHIVVDSGLHLSLSLRRVDGLGSALGDVATTIELRTLTTEPELVERDALALEGGYADILRHDGIATTDTRESCRL